MTPPYGTSIFGLVAKKASETAEALERRLAGVSEAFFVRPMEKLKMKKMLMTAASLLPVATMAAPTARANDSYAMRNLGRAATRHPWLTAQALRIACVSTFLLVLCSSALAQSTPTPNMPSSEEVQKRLDAMPPEKRQKLIEGLAKAMDEMNLLADLQSGKCTRAAEVTMKAIQGDPDSIYMESDMYRNGWCVAKDMDQFHADLEKAAGLGVASASFDIGFYLSRGDGGYAKDMRVARDWFEKAIKDGNEPRSMIALGDMLLSGDGGPKDESRGLRLLETAASGRDDNLDASNRALVILAVDYIQGDFVPGNVAMGRKYALRGAAQCDVKSMLLVAFSYQLDNPPRLEEAYAWANVASGRGDEQLAKMAAKTRADIEKSLTPEAIAKAQQLTKKLPVCTP
jgi:TPR repeat protein